MDMRRHLAAALSLGLAIGLAGCDDDFLTTLPKAEVADAAFWQTERDFVMAVNGAYREVLDTDQFFMEGASDFLYSKKDWTVSHPYAMGIQGASSGWSSGIWSRLYRGISRANDVLGQLETTTADISPAGRTEIEAQARFLRGYFYHELLWLFGEVPIYRSVPTIEEARSASRASRDEVINLVIEDLRAAAAGLPDTWAASQYGRATSGAALGYLARAALYEASYQQNHASNASRANELFRVAADAAQEVIDSGVYELHPDYAELFTYAGERSKEIIFDYQHVEGVNGWAAWAWFAPNSLGGVVDIHPTRAFVDEFRMTDGLTIDDSPLYDEDPPVIENGQVLSLGMFANRDPRFYASILHDGAEWQERPDDVKELDPIGIIQTFRGLTLPSGEVVSGLDTRDSPIEDWNGGYSGYLIRKYVDPAVNHQYFGQEISWMFFRYAEILLNYAEASIELNELEDARWALNQIRRRAGMPEFTATLSQDALRDEYRNERRVEMAFEEQRFFDARRWMIADEVFAENGVGIDIFLEGDDRIDRSTWTNYRYVRRDVMDRAWDDRMYFVPIHRDELNRNNLETIEKVFSESPCLDLFPEIFVGGGNHTDIDSQRPG